MDKTTKENLALKILDKLHKKGIFRVEKLNFNDETESFCEVNRGGVRIMKPLPFHASNKSTNKERKRVIHIEFSNINLPHDLYWNEKTSI